MSFAKLTVNIGDKGSAIDRAMTDINTQTKTGNHINDVVNGIAPDIQTGGQNPYSKIYDLKSNKYFSIKSKKGKLIVKKYVSKLKY